MGRARCRETGKVKHRSEAIAKSEARRTAAVTVSRGEVIGNLYYYTCDACGSIHLTRRSEYDGVANALAHISAAPELQRWAVPQGGPEVSAQNTFAGKRRIDLERRLARLPDPLPEGEELERPRGRYVQRPKGLRRKRRR